MATNTQKEFRKQMKALEKEGKISKGGYRRTVRFVEPRTLGLGAGTFLVILIFNALSGLGGVISGQPQEVYVPETTEIAVNIDQREMQLIQKMTAQIKLGKAFGEEELTEIKNEINALRDELPALSDVEGAVSIENRQLDQLDTIWMTVKELPLNENQIIAVNNAITVYNGLDIRSENQAELVNTK
jgi:hypothetical protein